MLNIYRRHIKACPHSAEGRTYRRCKCPIWVEGRVGGKFVRHSLDMRDWEAASQKVREWEATGRVESEDDSGAITIVEAWDRYMRECGSRGLRHETLRKYATLRRQMEAFATARGVKYLKSFDLEATLEFRSSWKNQARSSLSKLGSLRAFFGFCRDIDWIPENPATKVKNPRIDEPQTLPFEQAEMIGILEACSGPQQLRLRALVLLMRYSGLRISDASTLSRSRIKNGKLFLYTSKAGTPVWCPLPSTVISALDLVPGNSPCYFWTGGSKVKTVCSHWDSKMRDMFVRAGIHGGHSHRFRDTFAVSLLLAGKPIENVAMLLGHKSVRITEKHYSPWVRARQEQLEADVMATWENDDLLCVKMKRTYDVHGKQAIQ